MSTSKLSLVLLSLFTLALLHTSESAEAQNRQRVKATTTNQTRTAKAKTTRTNRQARPAATTATTPLHQVANANHSTKAQASLKDALTKGGSQFFERTVNGSKRLIANVSGQDALDKVSKAMGKDANVIQIVHIGKSNISHTMAIFDGELLHTQHVSGTQNWRLRPWGQGLRDSGTKMYSAFIALSAKEAATLRTTLAKARADQGPEHTAGPKWETGKLNNQSLGGCRSFDCVSTWTQMPLGGAGETLSAIAGLGDGYRSPRSLQKTLEKEGNDRVIGIAVYGPKIDNFKASPERDVVEF